MIDSHCHLLDKRYGHEEKGEGPLTPAQLVANARANGITDIVDIATTPSAWTQSLAFAQAEEGVWLAPGLHPGHVDEDPIAPSALEQQLVAISQQPKVVALGETGLDQHYTSDTSTLRRQHLVFAAHLSACQTAGLPAVIHTRDAEADTLAILRDFPKVSFVLHCFTGSAAMAEQAVVMGGYISFSGVLTFKNSHDLRNIAKNLPAERLLIETDAPYLAPEPQRGCRCQPALVAHTAAVLAATRSQSLPEIIALTRHNTQKLFFRIAGK